MLIIILILFWLMAISEFSSDPKNESNRWSSLILFWIGTGMFHPIIRKILIPHFTMQHHLGIINSLKVLANVFLVLAMLFIPFCLLMFCISGTDDLKWIKYKNRLAMLALTPILMMLVLFRTGPLPDLPNSGPILAANSKLWYGVTAVWVISYILTANYLLLSSYLKVKNFKLKQDRLPAILLITPSSLAAVFIFNIAPLIGLINFDKYSFIILLYLLTVLLFQAIKCGVSEIKKIIEKRQLVKTLQATFSGTAMLNHTIKNEVLNIDICMNNLIHYCKINNPDTHELLQAIQASNSHLLSLVKRVYSLMQNVVLRETPADLLEFTTQSLAMITPLLQAKNIKVSKDYRLEKTLILYDGDHLREVLRNIFANAIEAMGPGGELQIRIYKKTKRIFLAVTDNGTGIAKKDLPHVLKPFFSTKDWQQNFGLGLTYCYNIMNKHGGTLEIVSEKNVGTTVFLGFSPQKVLVAKLSPGTKTDFK